MRESSRPIVFWCPMTDQQVQSAIDDDLVGPDTIIAPVDCPICYRPHLIDPNEKSDKKVLQRS
jgi:hypothetical protein